MWTPEHRRVHARKGLRYPSDLTDAEWSLVEPLLPPARRGGRPREVNLREVLNAVFYLLSTGCQWDALPKDLPPKTTVYDYFSLWRSDRTLLRLHQALYGQVREVSGRKASPTVAIVDSQSAKAAQKGGSIDPQGDDAGKKVTGRKRHILVDRLGLLLNVVVRRGDGSRWHPSPVARREPPLPVNRQALRRYCLSGTEGRKGRGRYRHLAARNRQAHRTAQLRRSAKAMDRRAHLRLDQS